MNIGTDIVNLESQNLINVNIEEYDFFDKFLENKNIPWRKENRDLGILPLSRSYVGYIRTPLRKIDIEPKFAEVSIEHVIRLYNYVYSYQNSSDDDLLGINHSNKSIEQVFLNKLREQLSIGLLQEYEVKSNRIDFLKGNVDYVKTYKNSKLFKERPVETKAFELSMDLDINKLITGALTVMSHSNKYSSDSIELLEYFKGVSPCMENASDFLSRIVFTSKTNRYKRIASDAAMIIDSLYYDDTKGSVGGESFLINFDSLFELFVRKILLAETDEHDFSVWESPKIYAEEYLGKEMVGKREYLPDILYKFNPENPAYGYVPSAKAILDVKNKAYANFKNADVYQIMLYNQLLFADCNILIYPSFVERDSTHLNILNDNISVPKVSAAFINIAIEGISGFKLSIKNFIQKIYEILDN